MEHYQKTLLMQLQNHIFGFFQAQYLEGCLMGFKIIRALKSSQLIYLISLELHPEK